MKKVKKWFWYFFHNCLCHPLLPFLPKKLGNRLHDWSAEFIWPSASLKNTPRINPDNLIIDRDVFRVLARNPEVTGMASSYPNPADHIEILLSLIAEDVPSDQKKKTEEG